MGWDVELALKQEQTSRSPAGPKESPRASASQGQSPNLIEKEGAAESGLMEVLGGSKIDQLPKVWDTWLQEGIGPLAEKTQGVRAGNLRL